MSYPVSELRALGSDDLIARHDSIADNAAVGITYYLDELARRDAAESTNRLVELTEELARLTRTVTYLTIAIAILTAATFFLTLA